MGDLLKHLLNTMPQSGWETAEGAAALARLGRGFFQELHQRRYTAFDGLRALPFEDAFSVIRGLCRAESLSVSPFPGSVSLVNPAFHACLCFEQWPVIADWVVTNHPNDYTPFNFRKTRELWLSERVGSMSADETARRVQERERLDSKSREVRADAHSVSQALLRLRKGESPSTPDLRERMIRKMEQDLGVDD